MLSLEYISAKLDAERIAALARRLRKSEEEVRLLLRRQGIAS